MTIDTGSLLALGFGSPWLLLGAALAAIPAILHLLFRREHRAEPFAANRFLAEATRKHSRRLRFQHWVLLIVRTTILLLVAIALARPVLDISDADISNDRTNVHHLFILDATLSMRHSDRGQRRFDRGRTILQRTVEASHDGDTFRLLVIRGAGPPVVIAQAAGRRPDVLAELDRLEPTWETGREIETLQAALALLNTPTGSGRDRVSLVTDLQRSTWTPVDPGPRDRLRKALSSIRERSELVIYDVGGPAASNAAVVGLASETPVAIAGEPVTLRATVSHFGTGDPLQRQVEWHVDDRLVSRRGLVLVAGGTTTLDWTHRFARAGEHHIEVRLSGDGLPDDDHRHLALPVRDRLQVLLVGNRTGSRPDDASTFYVDAALDPGGLSSEPNSRSHSSRIVTTSIHGRRLVDKDLQRPDCVVLCDVPRLDRLEVSRLARFVAGGGGLVIGLGSSIDTEAWNRLLGEQGANLLPGRIGNLVAVDGSTQAAAVFDPAGYAHPLLSIFRGLDDNGLATTVTLKYLRAQPHQASRVALAFDSGDPAILCRRFGHGHVVLVTTSLDARWTTWPVLSTSFPPMVHELVRFATSSRWAARNHLVGQPITRPVGSSTTTGILLAPDGSQLPIQDLLSKNSAGDRRVLSNQTLMPGIYRLSLERPSATTESYGINVDTSESDLAATGGPTLRTGLLGIDSPIYTRWHDADAPVLFDQPGRPLGRILLGVLLGLLLVEATMAWRFLPGVTTMGMLLATVIAGWWAGAMAGAAAGLAVGAATALWTRRNRYGRHRWWSTAGDTA